MYSLLLGLCYLLQLWKIPFAVEQLPYNAFLSSFSSKTAYRNSKLLERRYLKTDQQKCQLIHMNAVFRHGTRHPSEEDISKIEDVHKRIYESRDRVNIPNTFVTWNSPFLPDQAKSLSSVGYEETMHLGKRFRERFDKYDVYLNETRDIAIFSSSVSRSKLSGASFLRKFLRNKKTLKQTLRMIEERDKELRFFDNCPYYTKTVLKNKTSKVEYTRFAAGPEIKQVISEIQNKWNLKDVNLNADDLRSLYVMCGYEVANNVSREMMPYTCKFNENHDELVCPRLTHSGYNETSSLCSLLDPHHYPIFEYLYDLKHYWTKSYGQDINWQQSCELIHPMMEQIRDAEMAHSKAVRESKRSGKSIDYHLGKEKFFRAVFWFGHAETILPLVAALNLFNQSSVMSATSYKERLELINNEKDRFTTFRVSNIAPFAGNVALELRYCPHLANNETNGYMVKVRSNEKTLRWSLADGNSQTTFERFMKYLKFCLPDIYSHDKVCIQGKNLQ